MVLWSTDGTSAGTRQVKNINAWGGSLRPEPQGHDSEAWLQKAGQ